MRLALPPRVLKSIKSLHEADKWRDTLKGRCITERVASAAKAQNVAPRWMNDMRGLNVQPASLALACQPNVTSKYQYKINFSLDGTCTADRESQGKVARNEGRISS